MILCGCQTIDHATPEQHALRRIAELNTAEVRYFAIRGQYGSLTDLASEDVKLISKNLSSGMTGGYLFEVDADKSSYQVRARPLRWKTDGRRSFYSDQSGTVRESWTEEQASKQSEKVK